MPNDKCRRHTFLAAASAGSLWTVAGGIVIGNDDALMDRAYSYHNFARPHGSFGAQSEYGYVGMGTKEDMDDIVDAVWKVYEDRKALVAAS